MSLSADTKDALAREIPEAKHCRSALLAGLALYGSHAGAFETQRNAVARLFRTLARGGQIEKRAGARLTHAASYRVDLPPGDGSAFEKPMLRCDRVMEARSALLACGSLSSAAHGYHLEFVPPDDARAERLAWILRSLAPPPKSMVRKGRRVLYYKDFEAIVELLTVIGAHGAVLRLEDVRALKETKNRIHRLVNTETANLERSAGAAAGHRATIEYVTSAYGLQSLSPALREIARVRLEHPDESLSELGKRCNPPISKAAVNGRLSALGRLARRGGLARGARKQ